MATLQIYAGADVVSNNSIKDARGCWKRGMVVEIYPDGVCTEPPTPGSKTVFVHIPRLPVDTVSKYLEQTESRRRTHKIDWSLLPNAVKNTLVNTLELTISINQLKKYIRNLDTNITGG